MKGGGIKECSPINYELILNTIVQETNNTHNPHDLTARSGGEPSQRVFVDDRKGCFLKIGYAAWI
jgi:hypothetical protein